MNTPANKSSNPENSKTQGHTPGPWTYRKASKHFHIEASAPEFGSAVADVKFVGNQDTGWTSENNARLIAASPELLEALVGMMKHMNRGTAEYLQAYEKSIAAIDKAEGRS